MTRRADRALPAWPLVAVLAAFPVWWVLGMGVLIFPLASFPMAGYLLRRGRPVRYPPGFLLWLLFLLIAVVSAGVLGVNPPGTLPGTAGGRVLATGFRLAEYLTLTVILLYAGNLTERALPRERLVRLLAWLFVVTVAGGLLGVAAGGFAFTSPIELLLPHSVAQDDFVRSLVHPAAAQVTDVLGHDSPRPAAPWGYTNTWGNNFCLLVAWFVVACFGYPASRRTRALALALLAVATIPVVYSLNRGLWIGLALSLGYVVVRKAKSGRAWGFGALGAAVLALTLLLTPLGGVVSERLSHGKSNGVRLYLTRQALAGVAQSPVVGFGSTRTTAGGRQSIAVGRRRSCPHCGNFTIGGNGQLWQLLYAHGVAGTACYLGFFLYGLWRFRRDTSAVGLAGGAVIVGSFVAMLWYNALLTPLALGFLGYAVLWRNAGAQFLSEGAT